MKERKFELKDYAALGLKKVLVTSSHGCGRKVIPSIYCTVFALIAGIAEIVHDFIASNTCRLIVIPYLENIERS